VGALLAGVVADVLGLAAAIWVVAVITAASGAVVASRMYETRNRTTRLGAVPATAEGGVTEASWSATDS
jgi:Flp pilus assembly protein TadB